jgi:hypothetical protein
MALHGKSSLLSERLRHPVKSSRLIISNRIVTTLYHLKWLLTRPHFTERKTWISCENRFLNDFRSYNSYRNSHRVTSFWNEVAARGQTMQPQAQLSEPCFFLFIPTKGNWYDSHREDTQHRRHLDGNIRHKSLTGSIILNY